MALVTTGIVIHQAQRQVIGYVLAREHTSIPGLVDVARLPRTLARRRAILRRRVRSSREIAHWFRA